MFTLRFSLNSPALLALNQSLQIETEVTCTSCANCVDFSHHQQWNHNSGWKNTLNNFRLIVQPLLLFWLIYPQVSAFEQRINACPNTVADSLWVITHLKLNEEKLRVST